MCTRCEHLDFAIDAEVVVHNRAAAKLPPLSADLIAKLESCSIPVKGAPDIEVRAASYVVKWVLPFVALIPRRNVK